MLIDRKHETALLIKMLERQTPEQIMNICESGGKGKSFLLRSFHELCRENQIPCAFIEFTSDQSLTPVNCMRDLVDRFGEERFPEFSRQDNEFHRTYPAVQIGGGESKNEVSLGGSFKESEISTIAGRDNIEIGSIQVDYKEMSRERKEHIERSLTKIFKKELLGLCANHPAMIIFDAYEHTPSVTAEWIQKNILNAVRDHFLPNSLIVLAGRPEGTRPKFVPNGDWNKVVINLTSLSEFAVEDTRTYFREHRGIQLEQPDLEAYHRVCKNNPLVMAQIADLLDVEK